MSAGDAPPVLAFADTNVWLYALLETQDVVKCAQARDIIRDTELVVSPQVINEVSFNLLRKAGFTEQRIQDLVASFYSRHRVVVPGEETFSPRPGCAVATSSLLGWPDGRRRTRKRGHDFI